MVPALPGSPLPPPVSCQTPVRTDSQPFAGELQAFHTQMADNEWPHDKHCRAGGEPGELWYFFLNG